MKSSELRDQTAEEVQSQLQDLQEEYFNLRFQHASGQLTTPIRLREVKRDIARIRTVLREHELGIRVLAGSES